MLINYYARKGEVMKKTRKILNKNIESEDEEQTKKDTQTSKVETSSSETNSWWCCIQ